MTMLKGNMGKVALVSGANGDFGKQISVSLVGVK